MKQILIGKSKAYATSPSTLTDATSVADGVIGVYTLSDGALVSSALPTSNFCIVVGRGSNKMPLMFPEVDVKSLTVEKSTAQTGSKFKATVNVGSTVTAGKEYTVIIAKKGVVFHERNTWTATSYAKGTTTSAVIDDLVKQINASTETSGVKASKASNTLVIEAVNMGDDYSVIGADELISSTITVNTPATQPILDKAYVQDLALACAAGKGFNLLGEDGVEIYPGFPEVVEDTTYVMYTLRFAVPRVAAKQRDEVVYQVVHIVLPSDAAAITTLDTVFGLSGASRNASEPGA